MHTSMNLKKLAEERIVKDDNVCEGKARIKGTRITVSDILLSLSEGMSQQDILRSYRGLMNEDIEAALAYAFCQSDGIKLNIGSAFDDGELEETSPVKLEQDQEFTQALEQQAAIQEDLTKEKIAEIKANKSKKTKQPLLQETKDPAPQTRPYDLLIDISGEPKTKVFANTDDFEQALDMSLDNYVFEKRADNKPWLCYSSKKGIDIDQTMKRNLLVTYSHNGLLKKAIFEGYLTTDRQHKIFIQRDEEQTCGRVL